MDFLDLTQRGYFVHTTSFRLIRVMINVINNSWWDVASLAIPPQGGLKGLQE